MCFIIHAFVLQIIVWLSKFVLFLFNHCISDFAHKNFKEEYMVGDEIILPDNNNVLNGYDVFQNQNVTKDGNNIN